MARESQTACPSPSVAKTATGTFHSGEVSRSRRSPSGRDESVSVNGTPRSAQTYTRTRRTNGDQREPISSMKNLAF